MRKQRFPLHQRELCYISLVPIAGVLFGHVISRLLIEFKDGVLFQFYERHPMFLAVVPVLALLFYAEAYLTISDWPIAGSTPTLRTISRGWTRA